MGKFIDLSGKVFGRLKVIKRTNDYISLKGKPVIQWLCECSCPEHNNIIVRGDQLKNGKVQSCGCLQKEMASKVNKKYNIYNLSNEYGIGYTSNGEEFWFDLEDYDKIKNYCWWMNRKGYVLAYDSTNKRNISFHRLLYPLSETVDHINHIAYDNRKQNLRICSQRENNLNRIMKPSDSSGIIGVRKSKNNKWDARIQVNGKYHTKRFDNFDDAVAQRKAWEKEFFGEYSYKNSIII